MVSKLSWTRKPSNYSLSVTTRLWSLFFLDCLFSRFVSFTGREQWKLLVWQLMNCPLACPFEANSWLTYQEPVLVYLTLNLYVAFLSCRGQAKQMQQVETREQVFRDAHGLCTSSKVAVLATQADWGMLFKLHALQRALELLRTVEKQWGSL